MPHENVYFSDLNWLLLKCLQRRGKKPAELVGSGAFFNRTLAQVALGFATNAPFLAPQRDEARTANAIREFARSNPRSFVPAEVAQVTGMRTAEVEEILRAANIPLSPTARQDEVRVGKGLGSPSIGAGFFAVDAMRRARANTRWIDELSIAESIASMGPAPLVETKLAPQRKVDRQLATELEKLATISHLPKKGLAMRALSKRYRNRVVRPFRSWPRLAARDIERLVLAQVIPTREELHTEPLESTRPTKPRRKNLSVGREANEVDKLHARILRYGYEMNTAELQDRPEFRGIRVDRIEDWFEDEVKFVTTLRKARKRDILRRDASWRVARKAGAEPLFRRYLLNYGWSAGQALVCYYFGVHVSRALAVAESLKSEQPLWSPKQRAVRTGAVLKDPDDRPLDFETLRARLLFTGERIPDRLAIERGIAFAATPQLLVALRKREIPTDVRPHNPNAAGSVLKLTENQKNFYREFIRTRFGCSSVRAVLEVTGVSLKSWSLLLESLNKTVTEWEEAWIKTREHEVARYPHATLDPLDLMYLEILMGQYGWKENDVLGNPYFARLIQTPSDIEHNRMDPLPFERFRDRFRKGEYVSHRGGPFTESGRQLAERFMEVRTGWVDTAALGEFFGGGKSTIPEIRRKLKLSAEDIRDARRKRLAFCPPELPGARWETKFIILAQVLTRGQKASPASLLSHDCFKGVDTRQLASQLRVRLPLGRRRPIWRHFQENMDVSCAITHDFLEAFPSCASTWSLRNGFALDEEWLGNRFAICRKRTLDWDLAFFRRVAGLDLS